MKIVIPGGSGQVGTFLARAFHEDGHEVVVLSRGPHTAPWRVVGWDGRTLGDWAAEIDGADVVVNLAGRSVNCRYNKRNRQLITESRTLTTRAVGEAITRAHRPPRVWLQASTATIYAHRYDAPNDELTGIIGGDESGVPETWRFSVGVARAWEAEVDAAVVPYTRKVKLRSAITMSPDRGGVFDTLLGLVRYGLGGAEGDGEQYVSWIHDQDFIRAIRWIIAREHLEGAINLAAPEPLSNAGFMQALCDAWGAAIALPASEWMLRLGTFVLSTETELVLKSRRVVPTILLNDGFTFEHPAWPEAARDLCTRWRKSR